MVTYTLDLETVKFTFDHFSCRLWRALTGVVSLLVLLPALCSASANTPFFAFKGSAVGAGGFDYRLEFVNTEGKTVTVELAVAAAGDVTDSLLAETVKNRLNSLAKVNSDYRFSAFQDNDGWWYVIGHAQEGKKPKPVKDGISISKGNGTLFSGAGVDPTEGYATFDVDGSPQGGQVFLAVNGFFVSTDTMYGDSSPKSVSQIKQELLEQLMELGFANAGLTDSGQLYVQGVSSGDPATADPGATAMSTDPGVGASANMELEFAAAESPRPPRGIVAVSPLSGPVGTVVTVNISKFPANSQISITFNGKQVTTITTNANGAGTGMFTVPEGTALGEREVRGAGGNPLTFGYGWFTVTKPK